MFPYNVQKFLKQPRNSSSASPLASFCQDLIRRKLLAVTHPNFPYNQQDITAYSATLPSVLYTGFDPTSSSLHIGNLLVLNSLIRSHLFGCFPIVLIGEATASIGDPSGHKTAELLREIIHENARALNGQVRRIVSNASSLYGVPITVDVHNNLDWYDKMKLLDFFEYTKRFRVGEMLRSGPVKSRMDIDGATLSYAEFSYQIMQAIDWLKLAEQHNCLCQLGGSDQLGNFKAGFEHIRAKTEGLSLAFGLPLLTDENGEKLGKSTAQKYGTGFWLDPLRTSAFAFYQYLRQLHDDLAENFLIQLSLRNIEEIEGIVEEHRNKLGKWIAQQQLADELTALVHGSEGLEKAKKCSQILFDGHFEDFEQITSEEIREMFGPASTFNIQKSSVATLGELADLTRKRGAQLMRSGALRINGVRKTDPEEKLDPENKNILFRDQFTLVCWGRRKFSLVTWF